MIYKDFISNALEAASKIAKEKFGHVESSIKNDNSIHVLTEADLVIGSMLIQAVKDKFPEHNIIDEEAGVIDNKSEYTWVIDPIDGTSNFANGIATYGIIFGLLEGDAPIAGGLALPFFNEVYFAEKGCGAYCNGKKITVSGEVNLANVLLAYNIDGHLEDPGFTKRECDKLANLVLRIRNLRSSGSVFDLAMVAKGQYGAHLNRTSKIWDNVAQQIIIEEAGGVYTDFDGEKIDYSNPMQKTEENFSFIAAPPEIHRQILDTLKN
jgi:myo-inositol-1(or 4)-monophosphatase